MTKTKKESPAQTSIFDILKEAHEATRQTAPLPDGSLDVDRLFRIALSQDIKHAQDPQGRDLSRAQVAARMTDLLGLDADGKEITVSMLNNWTAESHDNHRMPAVYVPALVLATGGQSRAFEVLTAAAGLFALPGEDALRAEIRLQDEIIKKATKNKRQREALLKEVTHGKK